MKKLIITIGIVLGVLALSSCGGSSVVAPEESSSSSIVTGVSSSSIDTGVSVGTSSSSAVTDGSSSSVEQSSSSVFVDDWSAADYAASQADFYDQCSDSYSWWSYMGQSGGLWVEIQETGSTAMAYNQKGNLWFSGAYFDGANTAEELSYLKNHAGSSTSITLTCVAFMHRSVVKELEASGITVTLVHVYFEQY